MLWAVHYTTRVWQPKSLTSTAPYYVDISWCSANSPKADSEWAPMSIGKKSDNWIICCHNFLVIFYFQSNFHFYVNKKGLHNIKMICVGRWQNQVCKIIYWDDYPLTSLHPKTPVPVVNNMLRSQNSWRSLVNFSVSSAECWETGCLWWEAAEYRFEVDLK